MQIPLATKIEIDTAHQIPFHADSKGDYSTTALYMLPGEAGIYRRVSREGRNGVMAGEGNVLAIVPAGNRNGKSVGTLAELTRWQECEDMVSAALLPPPSLEKPF